MRVRTGLVEGGYIVANGGYSFSSLVLPMNARGRRAYRGGQAQKVRSIVMAEPEQEEVEWSVDEGEVEETEQAEQEEETPETPEPEAV